MDLFLPSHSILPNHGSKLAHFTNHPITPASLKLWINAERFGYFTALCLRFSFTKLGWTGYYERYQNFCLLFFWLTMSRMTNTRQIVRMVQIVLTAMRITDGGLWSVPEVIIPVESMSDLSMVQGGLYPKRFKRTYQVFAPVPPATGGIQTTTLLLTVFGEPYRPSAATRVAMPSNPDIS